MSKEKAIKNLLASIDKLDPTGANSALYKKLFNRMSNKEFMEWANKIKRGELKISLVVPNGNKDMMLTRKRLKQLAKDMGIKLFERVIFSDNTGNRFMPKFKHNILMLTVARMNQHHTSYISVPKNTNVRNPLTDQVTGDSKAASLTLPEMYILNGKNLTYTLDELSSVRGGDRRAMLAMEDFLIEHGKVTLKDLKPYRTKASAVKRMKSYFKAMHMDINV